MSAAAAVTRARVAPAAAAGDAWPALVDLARLAPSSHNTQPWRFRVTGPELELLADRGRRLSVVDPMDRELTISCGAALACLEVAARGLGHEVHVVTPADHVPLDAAGGPGNDVLARVRITGPHATTPDDRRLLRAIALRRTDRGPYAPALPPSAALARVARAAAMHDAGLLLVADADRRARVARLVELGTVLQHRDRAFRRELARWLRPARRFADGIPTQALGQRGLAALVAPAAIALADFGARQSREDREFVAAGPVLALLHTPEDTPAQWLATGRALGRLLLEATGYGLGASFFNQPIQLPHLRDALREELGCAGQPQILLRLGRGTSQGPTGRRPLRAVLEERP